MSRNWKLYFIRPVGMDGPVKIGIAVDVQKRLDLLNAWSPFPLEVAFQVPGGHLLERNVHDCFADLHSHGEWFRGGVRLTAAIAALRAGHPIHLAIDLDDRRGCVRAPAIEKQRQTWAKRKAAA